MSFPARKIDNKCPGKIIGYFQSHKMGCSFQFESILEKHFLALLDINPTVEQFFPQPKRFWYVEDGVKRHYTPDVCVHYIGRERPIYYEVKPISVAAYWERIGKTERLRSLILQCDADFEVVTSEHIESEPRLTNTLLLRRYRNLAICEHSERKVMSCLRTGGYSIDELVSLNRDVPNIRGIIYALAYHQKIIISQEFLINGNSLTSLGA